MPIVCGTSSGMPWRRLDNIGYETIEPGSHHYVECEPDLRVPTIADIEPDALVELGAEHVLCDVDGAITPSGKYELYDERSMQRLCEIARDARFRSLDLATDSHANISALASRIGPNVRMFQPIEEYDGRVFRYKNDPLFWQRILKGLRDPLTRRVVMIGDSPRCDIAPARSLGMLTVQVDHMVAIPRSHAEIMNDND